MSSDSYILIDKHPNGGFAVEDRFMSDDSRPVSPKSTSYPSIEEAVSEAHRRVKLGFYEYGISISTMASNDTTLSLTDQVKG